MAYKVPELLSTFDQVVTAMEKAKAEGNTDLFNELAKDAKNIEGMIATLKKGAAQNVPIEYPTDNMSTMEKIGFGAKAGLNSAAKAVSDLVYQDILGVQPKEFPEWQARTQRMNEAVDRAGLPAGLASMGASMLPEAAMAYMTRGGGVIPQIATTSGGAFATTPGSTLNRTMAAGITAAGGGVGAGAGAGLGATAKGSANLFWDLADQFTADGQKRAARDIINRSADEPSTLQNKLANPRKSAIPGYPLTVADSIDDFGIRGLERASQSGNEQAAEKLIGLRKKENSIVRDNFYDMGGQRPATPGNSIIRASDVDKFARGNSPQTRYDQAVRNRDATSDALFGAARNEDVIIPMDMAEEVAELSARPTVQKAYKEMLQSYKNAGKTSEDLASAKGLHNLRAFVNDEARRLGKATDDTSTQKLWDMQDLLRDIDGVLERVNPTFKQANTQHAINSVPINQMDVANVLRQQLFGVGDNFKIEPKYTPNIESFNKGLIPLGGREVGDSVSTVKTATGNAITKPIKEVMSDPQLAMLKAIKDEMDVRNKANENVRAPRGSDTKSQFNQNQDIYDRIAFVLPNVNPGLSILLSRVIGSRVANSSDQARQMTEKLVADSLVDPKAMSSILKTPDRPPSMPNAVPKGAKLGATSGLNTGTLIQEFANDLSPSTRPLSDKQIRTLLQGVN